MPLTSGLKPEPYEIAATSGAGGMGEIYRARDTRLQRTVAIRILPSPLSENSEAKQRLGREHRAIFSLSHPNIYTLHDVGSQGGTDFRVIKCLEGETSPTACTRGQIASD